MDQGTLDRYTLLEKLGAGGMGVVYKALDTRLDRVVALKFLPEELSIHTTAKKRFLREAKAAAALDHTNIAVVHDFGETSDRLFIAMGYYEGETLVEMLDRGPLPLEKVLEYGGQIADGLAEAHSKGIVHRDIKPGNVLVTKSVDSKPGVAKILDFGLAKVSGETTLTRGENQPGTVAYMSPEQIRGDPLDFRTDLWSLGVLLYELIVGRRPFKGESDATAIHAILNTTPVPLSELEPELPEPVEDLVMALLSKDRDRRPRDARHVATLLRKVRFSVETTREMPDVDRYWHEQREAVQGSQTKRTLTRWSIVATALALLVAAGWLYLTLDRDPPMPVGRPTRVTDLPGWEADSVISPKGGLIAFTSNASGNADIWLVDAKGGIPLQLTTDPADDRQPSWFPDGTALAFVSDRSGESAIWRIPRLGGSSTMLVSGATDPAVAPDGRSIAVSRFSAGSNTQIAIALLDRPQNPQVLTGPNDGLWYHSGPAWSPDGRWLCYSDYYDLWLVPTSGGSPRQLTSEAEGDLEPVWSSDGHFVYFSSYRDETLALWRIRVNGGVPQRMTVGSGPERNPSISFDGQRLAYDTFIDDQDIVLVDLETGDRSIIPGPRSEDGPALAPDGSAIVFSSNRWGYSLWHQPLAGLYTDGEARRLNDELATSSNPAYSPDGRWVAYQRRDGTDREVWVLAVEGGVPQKLIDGRGVETHPAWAPDGSAIAYVAYDEGLSELWVAQFNEGRASGSPVQIRTAVQSIMHPVWSDDGESLAYMGSQGEIFDIWRSWLDADQEPVQLTFGVDPYFVRWRPGTQRILVSAPSGMDRLSLMEVDLMTGEISPSEPAIEFGAGAVYGVFDVDKRGRLLAFSREQMQGDVWLLEAETGSY